MFVYFKMVFSLFICSVFLFTQTGCSFLVGSQQQISVNASESDAEIYVNGQLVGHGNATTMVRRDQTVSIMAKKDGFYPMTRDIGTNMSMVGVLDIIGGCLILIPFVGLAAPGAKELSQNSVSLTLQKEK